MSNVITIQDVFHQFLPKYSETHLFSSEQHMAALCISKCKTAEMGANISECESCHKKYIHYNSCKNRHCPMCQGMEVDEWIDKYYISVIPTLLGNGVRLLGNIDREIKLRLCKTQTYNGITDLIYMRR
ncbi:hypothetical protein P869_05130 [Ligilactobacillus ruminis S23]|nr:transposase zinc-binding domain-containing protein [Ligilactobacillus ruminis]KLA48214.1 hypothetical protein P869_05130 [Ligilactobacillus ruminis S23]